MTDPRPRQDDDPLRVLGVDADDRVRESLTGLLVIGGRCMVVASSGEVGEALALAQARTPDLVIIDPRLPDVADGMTLIARLRAQQPDVRIVAMGWSDSLGSDVLQLGADGYLRKTFRPTELVKAVLAAARRDAGPTAQSA